MARGVTQDQVTYAADALLARGERPTIEKVRAELGTGSPNTLLRLLDVWWAELAARLAAQARAQLPEIPDAVQRAMMTLWSESVVTARQEAAARYADRERQLAECETAIKAQLMRIAAEKETQQQTLQQAFVERDVARRELTDERRRVDDLQQSLSTALHSLSEAQSTITSLRHAGENAQKALQLDRERTAAKEQHWLREVDRAREDAKVTVREVRATHTKLAAEIKRCVHLRRELAAHKQQVKDLERRLKLHGKDRADR